MYNYRQILKQAFKLAWENPILWFFGFFLVLSGNTSEMELLLGGYSFGRNSALASFLQGLADGGLFTQAGIKAAGASLTSHPFIFFSFILLTLLIIGISVLAIWLTTVSQSALIGQIIGIVKRKELSWRQGFTLGMAKFWPVLCLNILARLIIWSLFAFAAVLTLLKFPGFLFIFILIFDLFLLLVIVVSFIAKYAIIGVVLKDWRFSQALKLSWKLFTRNWLLSLEIAIVLFGIYFLATSFLLWLLFLIFVYSLKIFIGFTFGLPLVWLILLSVFIVIQIVLAIFHWATWAIVFELLTAPKTVLASWLSRKFKSLPPAD